MRLKYTLLIFGLLSFTSCMGKDIKNNRTPLSIKSSEGKKNDDSQIEFPIINAEYFGIYLPVDYINILKGTKNHALAIHDQKYEFHNLLIVKNDSIESNIKWHDSFLLSNQEAASLRFYKENDESFVLDSNDCKYIRISPSIENCYEIIDSYIISIIFENIPESSEFKINKDIILLKGIPFKIKLDDMFFQKNNNVIIYNFERKIYLGLIITGKNYTFYIMESKNNDSLCINTREIFYQTNI